MTDLLADLLALPDPWYVAGAGFEDEITVTVVLEFPRGAEFACSACGTEGCKAYDTHQKRWRHRDLFQYRCFLVAFSPRVECPECGRVCQAVIPWARLRSRVTYDFEEYVLALADELPSYRVMSRVVGEHDTRLRRIIKVALKGRAGHGKWPVRVPLPVP